ncbi:MAG: ATP-binding protein, partial [Tardiphaga sp.]|nr:ATP-binding protein [Tardiphaga sp.]
GQALASATAPQSSLYREGMAYAPPATATERTAVVTASASIPRGIRPMAVARNPMAVNNITTVVGKNTPGRAITISTRLAAAPMPDNNVWMRAMIIAPSASTSMSSTVLGDSDLTVMRDHFVKPQTVVSMSFSDDPQLGLVSDQFTGSATGTLTTTLFVRTAALR